MMLEAVWFKNGEEACRVSPVVNIVSYADIKELSDIEVEDGVNWHSYKDFVEDADDFVIRIKEGAV